MNPSVLPAPPVASLPSTPAPTAGVKRRIAVAVNLSDESYYAVQWAVQNYLRPGDAVVLLHVRPTSVLYGADWGSIQLQITPNSKNKHENARTIEEEFDIFATARANKLAQPLVDANVPFKIHIVKDRDMKERLCLEVERLRLSAVIMGSRGFGGSRRSNNGRLGSVSYYCVNHCICPVVVVRCPDEHENGVGRAERVTKKKIVEEDVVELQPLPEEELEYHDGEEEHKV
ncbi:Adenine nucleotide alpha hydrolases-like superfamily protein isoform 2 [Hibiscus syriacus]|uniref:Adenine nucleotide alpha hydrolases-like superfamily protein isoform 2 n=1 Tax=Hibiscus syriacus TaxID=106335 RepID=A0A6A3CXL9_HIBSY|nr:universal stress protein PHOS34-like [Hibiscus syriacus]KAE8733866.1 Adenine nucleotide alpha hydrolases-like superfamily protein isoform 2 [Hibiscus syriacus]